MMGPGGSDSIPSGMKRKLEKDEYFDTAHYLYKSFAMAVIDVYTDILADDWEVVE
jgi:hypothetical protein